MSFNDPWKAQKEAWGQRRQFDAPTYQGADGGAEVWRNSQLDNADSFFRNLYRDAGYSPENFNPFLSVLTSQVAPGADYLYKILYPQDAVPADNAVGWMTNLANGSGQNGWLNYQGFQGLANSLFGTANGENNAAGLPDEVRMALGIGDGAEGVEAAARNLSAILGAAAAMGTSTGFRSAMLKNLQRQLQLFQDSATSQAGTTQGANFLDWLRQSGWAKQWLGV
ncbi:MAG: hypothetical protein IT340_20030 [Chloroflexi bacterium]|nr:hypothetical protein [Chloroflexota bacterium]